MKVLNKCAQCYFHEGRFDRKCIIAESEHAYVSIPLRT